MQRKKVGLFFGGISPEHEVSITSARGIIENIDLDKFIVKEFFIDKNGNFWTAPNLLKKNKYRSEKQLQKADLNNLNQQINVAFPILHGEGGEDGTIQGFFKTLNIPFVGADVLASAVCLDKAIFKQLMKANDIPQPKFAILDFSKHPIKPNIQKMTNLKKSFKLPVFIKPASGGSSIGITKLVSWNDSTDATSKAKEVDSKIIIEESIENCLEIEVSVIGNDAKNVKASLPGHIIPGAEFYDYDDKYNDDKTQFEIPAKLSKKKTEEVQELALKVYQIADCIGFARVDFLVSKNGKIYLNEINTIPGFTPISMYPKLWQNRPNYKNLITKLLLLALKRKRKKADNNLWAYS